MDKKPEHTHQKHPDNGSTNTRTGVRVWVIVQQNGDETISLSTPKLEEQRQAFTIKH